MVPKKFSNKGKASKQPAERMEGRGSAKGNAEQQNRDRAQNREALQHALNRVRKAAKEDRKRRFTTLWHHVYDPERLLKAYSELKADAAAGIDGQTVQDYERDREANLQDLSNRLKRGTYRARPVRRVYIPKPDGGERPLGVPTLEDKIVQRATAEVLQAIYEVDFMSFSYGFRPKRKQHDALDALAAAITTKKVNWVLDADIRAYFDSISHEWLVKFLQHRIADKRVVRHIQKWLNAGVLEDGQWRSVEEGTPQGASISPLLANVYLHYVLDLYVNKWRKVRARGQVVIVRFADDFILGFELQSDAESFLADLHQRLAKFSLELHPKKTRLIEFGRFAAERRKRGGQEKPETFNFLGFTHICATTRTGRFMIRRQTIRKRLRTKLRKLKEEIRRAAHGPIPAVGKWLRKVLKGHYNYFGVPTNYDSLSLFRFSVVDLWHRALRRRSQKDRTTWARMKEIAALWLPLPRIVHPYPVQRFYRHHPRQEPGAGNPLAGICAGGVG
jgi:group II intron reverse transcriptase/maturase